jgi:hypothetical protein
VVREIGDQGITIGLPAFRIAQSIQLQHTAVQYTEVVEDFGTQSDNFDIRTRALNPQNLRIDLMELAQTAFLRVSMHFGGQKGLTLRGKRRIM